MQTGAITSYIDVAQLTLYGFWIFFFGLIWHIRREDKREGYPVVSDLPGRVPLQEQMAPPAPKVFLLHNGETVLMPPPVQRAEREVKALPIAKFPGAPLEPTGDPMIDGVGPASWAERTDTLDVLWDSGAPRIVPMRTDASFYTAPEDPNPIGMQVVGCDGLVAGIVRDMWVDRSEYVLRFLEVELTAGGRHVLVPTTMIVFTGSLFFNVKKVIRVRSITSGQFANVPAPKSPDQITRLEEDKIYAYFAGGTLYATAARSEPLL